MTTQYRVTIADESWVLEPPRGLKAMRRMPKVLSYVSKLIYVAIQAGFPVQDYISGERDQIDLGDALKAIKFIADSLGENYEEFETEIVPFLLQRDPEWLAENGTLVEIATALWTSIQMLFSLSTQEDVDGALKKSAEDQEVEVETTD